MIIALFSYPVLLQSYRAKARIQNEKKLREQKAHTQSSAVDRVGIIKRVDFIFLDILNCLQDGFGFKFSQ